MAVKDSNGKAAGKPIEIVPNQQNKSDIDAAIARRWFDNRLRRVALVALGAFSTDVHAMGSAAPRGHY